MTRRLTSATSSERAKPRLIAMNDFGTDDNDNQQYLVRLLLYSNEIDIEGIIPTTSEFQPDTVRPDFAYPIIDAYGQVQPNLLKHSPDYPTADYLRKIVAVGPSVFGLNALGNGRLSPGAQWIGPSWTMNMLIILQM